MSAVNNKSNHHTTNISIAVPDRLYKAINWAVKALTSSLDETLTQYQTSVVGDYQLVTDAEGNPIQQSDVASVDASSVNTTNPKHHEVKEEVKSNLLSVPAADVPKASAAKMASFYDAIAGLIASKMMADGDKSVEKLEETLEEAN